MHLQVPHKRRVGMIRPAITKLFRWLAQESQQMPNRAPCWVWAAASRTAAEGVDTIDERERVSRGCGMERGVHSVAFGSRARPRVLLPAWSGDPIDVVVYARKLVRPVQHAGVSVEVVDALASARWHECIAWIFLF